MSLVDSLDSVLMLYAYAQPDLRSDPKRRFLLWTAREEDMPMDGTIEVVPTTEAEVVNEEDPHTKPTSPSADDDSAVKLLDPEVTAVDEAAEARARSLEAKTATISSLSISLTLLSIVVALSISLIEIMGLIGENCAKCTEAAEDPNGGGLAGSWWRAWARVSA